MHKLTSSTFNIVIFFFIIHSGYKVYFHFILFYNTILEAWKITVDEVSVVFIKKLKYIQLREIVRDKKLAIAVKATRVVFSLAYIKRR